MANRCTWKSETRCEETATHPQTASDGRMWANLCDKHHAMLDATVGVDARKMLSYWVKAQGGSRAAANRMTGGAHAVSSSSQYDGMDGGLALTLAGLRRGK